MTATLLLTVLPTPGVSPPVPITCFLPLIQPDDDHSNCTSGGPHTYAAGTVVVRVKFDQFGFYHTTTYPTTVPLLSTENDWIMDGLIQAAAPYQDKCRAESRSGHSRFIPSTGIDFTLRFNGTYPCSTASYTIHLLGNVHDADELIDLCGTLNTTTIPVPCTGHDCPLTPNADFSGCEANIPIGSLASLAGTPVSANFSGFEDGQSNQYDAILNSTTRVLFSNVDGITDPNLTRWLVHVDLANFTMSTPPAGGADYNIDAKVSASDGSCTSTVRTMHTRFVVPEHLDLLLRDAAGCENTTLNLHLVPYTHLYDSLIDINGGTSPGGQQGPCPPDIGPNATTPLPDAEEVQSLCDARYSFNLTAGFDTNRTGNGSADSQSDVNDGHLDYHIHVYKNFTSLTAHIAFSLTPDAAPNPGANVDDWLIDGNATTNDPGCNAQWRTSHSRYYKPTGLDLTVYGPVGLQCPSPMTVKLLPYTHEDDTPIDINSTLSLQLCPAQPAPTDPNSWATCALAITWDAANFTYNAGSSDGLADGNPVGEDDATVSWNLTAYSP